MTRRLLLVAYYFPPLGGIASLRALSFARDLPAHGWEVTVLAPASGAFHLDPSVAFDEDRVVRTASLELSGVGKRVLRTGGGDLQPASVSGSRRVLRDLAHSHVYFPDAQVGWLVPALVTGSRLLRGAGFDAVLSSAWPVTAHLVARRLARSAGVPWVADFRDPWAERMPPGTLRARRAARLERRLADDAAALTMASPSWARRHGARWEREVEVVLNGHDIAEPLSVAPRPGVVAYLGTYYAGGQDLRAAWSAIAGSDNLRLEVIGALTPELAAELGASGIPARSATTGFVSNAEAARRIAAADVLLLAGPIDGATSFGGAIPAKVFEYLATDRPIVYVGDPDCDVAELLRSRAGCALVATGDVPAVAAALAAASGTSHDRDAAPLSRSMQAARMARTLRRVVDGVAADC